ncbi:MAG: hypothetical protein WCV55_03595 [Candidatus Paceibacterota bacterium]
MKSRIQTKSVKKPRKHKKSRKGYFFLVIFILLVAGILFGVHYLFNLPRFRIDQIKITELSYADNNAYLDKAFSTISGSYYFGLIPKDSIFFYPKKDLLQNFVDPDVKEIQISNSGNILNINITERHAVFLWCNNDGSVCDYLDQDGISFSVAPQIKGSAYITFVDGREPQVGVSALTKEDMDIISKMIDSAKTFGFSIVKFDAGNREANIYDSSGMFIKFDLDKDAVSSAYYLKEVLSSNELKNLDKSNIEYLDLRFGNKVLLKRKGVN